MVTPWSVVYHLLEADLITGDTLNSWQQLLFKVEKLELPRLGPKGEQTTDHASLTWGPEKD